MSCKLRDLRGVELLLGVSGLPVLLLLVVPPSVACVRPGQLSALTPSRVLATYLRDTDNRVAACGHASVRFTNLQPRNHVTIDMLVIIVVVIVVPLG